MVPLFKLAQIKPKSWLPIVLGVILEEIMLSGDYILRNRVYDTLAPIYIYIIVFGLELYLVPVVELRLGEIRKASVEYHSISKMRTAPSLSCVIGP